MTNILESAKSIISTLTDDEPVNPLHVGEVISLWTYHTMLSEINSYIETGLNTTTDDELIAALKNSYADCSKHIKEIETVLLKEGVTLPPTTEHKPHSDPNEVPQGAKLSDDEIANGLMAKQVAAVPFCATGLVQSIRVDIGKMWLGFFLDRVKFGAYFQPLMRKRGWLKVPPYYYPPGRPKK